MLQLRSCDRRCMETMMEKQKDDLGNLVLTFSDGTVCNFGGGTRADGKKRPEVKAHKKVDMKLRQVRWYFSTGDMRIASLIDYQESIQVGFSLHGVSQKLGDCYASAITAQEALESWDSLNGQLIGGDWEKPTREGGANDGGILAQAVAKVLGCSVADAAATLKAMEGKERKALELEPDIAKELAAMRKARAGNADPAGVRGKLEGLLGRKSADVM